PGRGGALGAAHRAQRAAGHGAVPARDRAVVRQGHRARHARGGGARSGGHRRVPGDDGMSEPLLRVDDLVVAYGHVQAVPGLSLPGGGGEIVALIGPNGAGKSSTLGALAGLVAPAAGSVKLAGADIAGRPAHAIVAAGVVLVPEGRAVLQRMTVEENLILGAESRRPRAPRAAIDAELQRVPALRPRPRLPPGALSRGGPPMLPLARGLLARPRVPPP